MTTKEELITRMQEYLWMGSVNPELAIHRNVYDLIRDLRDFLTEDNMFELELFYSVQNCGDGSAYPRFMESKELCKWDQDRMYEGWGESCDGSITLTSESPITVKDKIMTKEEYLFDLIEYDPDDSLEEFKEQFFPNGVPHFTVGEPHDHYKEYACFPVYDGDRKVHEIFTKATKSPEVIEKELNGE